MNPAVVRCVIAASLVAALACDPSIFTGTGAAPNGQVSWRVLEDRVEVKNTSNQTLLFSVVGRTWMHSALVTFCFGAPTCGTALSANQTGLINYIDISGSAKPETEAMLVWWIPNGPGNVPFDTAIVRIR